MYETEAFGVTEKGGKFGKMRIERGEAGPDDVEFDVKFCGICHTDIHYRDDDMGGTQWPCVPGHELAGVVVKVGANVSGIAAGDKVGVGCIVDCCMACAACAGGEEHACEKGFTMTYAAETKHGHISTGLGWTLGGYSRRTTVHKRFVIRIPDAFPLEFAGPIFCAAITMYDPLKHWGATKGGLKVGIVGIGGLGQMGVRLAAAMGNEVTAISTSPSKEETARKIGASRFVVSSDADSMAAAAKSLDLVLNTVSASHEVTSYTPLLARNGTIVQLGVVLTPHSVSQLALMRDRISIAGSIIGGMPNTQECMDFCAEKGIRPEIELITDERLDEVFEILAKKNDTIKRYVLDLDKCE